MAPSQSMEEFRKVFKESKFILVLTGAGISAESGIPTFRGPGAFWRGFAVQTLADGKMFKENASLVWEFYHYRREIVFTKKPNEAHKALAECQRRLEAEGKRMVIITQNIDEFHSVAGAKDVIELHGTLFKTRCTQCGHVANDFNSPICPSLLNKGAADGEDAKIPPEELPRCQENNCCGLLRPHIVWFDEDPTDEDMKLSYEWMDKCDLCLIIGTSSVVEPANEFGPYVTRRGVPVAEFNIEPTVATQDYQFLLIGKAGSTVSEALAP